MADKEARIRISIDNATGTISDIKRISGAFEGIKGSLAGLKKMADDAAGAVVRIRPINFTKSTDEAEAFRLQLTRMSMKAGQSVEELTAKFEKIGARIKISAPEVAALASEYAGMTYDVKGAVDTIEDLGIVANNSGRPLQDMLQIGATLHNSLGVPLDEVVQTLRQIEKTARNVGTVGMGRGLSDSLKELGPVLEQFDTSTESARKNLVAFVALAGGKLPHRQATEAAGSALGWIASDALGLGRYLGHSIVRDGKVDDPIKVLEEIMQKVRRSGSKDRELRVLGRYTTLPAAENLIRLSMRGAEDALLGKEEAAAGRAAGLPGVGAYDLSRPLTPAQRVSVAESLPVDKLGQTAAGKLEGARVERENAERGMGRGFLKGRDYYETNYSAEEKIAIEAGIETARSLPYVGTLATMGHYGLAADALSESRVESAPQKTRAEMMQEEQLRLQREQLHEIKTSNQLLRRSPDRNRSEVDNRKRAAQ